MQPNNPEQFTEKAFQAISTAQDVVKAAQQQQMESEHLLKALLEQDSLATSILTKAGVNLAKKAWSAFPLHPWNGSWTCVFISSVDLKLSPSVSFNSSFQYFNTWEFWFALAGE